MYDSWGSAVSDELTRLLLCTNRSEPPNVETMHGKDIYNDDAEYKNEFGVAREQLSFLERLVFTILRFQISCLLSSKNENRKDSAVPVARDFTEETEHAAAAAAAAAAPSFVC